MTELITNILAYILGFIGLTAYIIILITIIVDMCNKNPYMSNWDYIKECFKK